MYNVFLTQDTNIIFGPIAKLLGVILNLIYNFLDVFGIANAALCIFLFTFIVKALMIPLTLKQQKFSKLSSTMNPEITAIQAKYKGKKDEESMRKMQLETQAVYQKYGANPTSGCLPLLITLPIIFALYRVIYNIPAYVDVIYALYSNIAVAIQGIPGYAPIMSDYAVAAKMSVKTLGDMSSTISTNHLIDIMAKFDRETWNELMKSFPTITDIIKTNSAKIIDINSFLGGLNIADKPGFKWPGVLVPIFAMVFQFIQGKQLEANQPVDPNNPTANTMKTMNNVMPIMSGFFCVSLPIGVGLYWVAGSIFQILQQFFVNKYMAGVNVEDMIEKNLEKAKKRKIKLGLDPDQVDTMAHRSTKSLSDVTTDAGRKSTSNYANMKTNTSNSDYISGDVSYKKGSIASNANLLKREKSDKGEK